MLLSHDLLELALSLIVNPSDKSVTIGGSKLIGQRQANLILLSALMLTLNGFAGYWIDKLNLNPLLYNVSFLSSIGVLWVTQEYRITPYVKRRFSALTLAGTLIALSIFSGSAASGNRVLNDDTCVPNYFPCIPADVDDLDCNEVQWRVDVIGTDEFSLDRDRDGIGCEWNPVFTPDETIEK